jgi:hypothetical protein
MAKEWARHSTGCAPVPWWQARALVAPQARSQSPGPVAKDQSGFAGVP